MSMWDERYSAIAYAYGVEPNDFLRSVADRIPPGPVLCLAEGQGRNALCVASLGHEVLAVDQSAVGLARARELAASRGVSQRTLGTELKGAPGRRSDSVCRCRPEGLFAVFNR